MRIPYCVNQYDQYGLFPLFCHQTYTLFVPETYLAQRPPLGLWQLFHSPNGSLAAPEYAMSLELIQMVELHVSNPPEEMKHIKFTRQHITTAESPKCRVCTLDLTKETQESHQETIDTHSYLRLTQIKF